MSRVKEKFSTSEQLWSSIGEKHFENKRTTHRRCLQNQPALNNLLQQLRKQQASKQPGKRSWVVSQYRTLSSSDAACGILKS